MRVDRAARRIDADLPAVFAAFTDAELFLAWLPPAGMSGRLERFEPQVGGGYRMVLSYDEPPPGGGKADASSDVAEAHIAELDPAGRIVWEVEFPSEDPAAAGLMTMTWTLSPADDGTLVSVAAVDVPAAISPEAHAEGLRSSLAQLATVVGRR
ncbi:SRPBCC domain-containing protein [Nesterenkonia halobia]|uniref:Activator of Hsp90 ATPase homologue 1/2-like C-terminal domain-containing protein n=1 Tax=Nesterenkonia halobia TaxID=37922 RepID=A0ABP6REM9_9MICC